MNYERLITKPYGNTEIEYGSFLGNFAVLFMKAGYQGNIYGYQNKYLQMASHLHQKYGITTIVSSNPFNGENPLGIDMTVINELTNNQVSKIYYMGHSNGAVIGACWGGQYPLIKRMLLINPPMMINWHKTKQGLKCFQGERATFVFGERDPSAKYAGLIELLKQDNLHLVIFPNADHHFKGLLTEFMELPETYLLK